MPRKVLSKQFYQKETAELARALLGTFLCCSTKQGEAIGRIVETEAYLYQGDPGCHAHRGKTKRNAPMFGTPGRSYVYLCYGMYQLFNVVSDKSGRGAAVLIRALEPVSGIELMQQRRGKTRLTELCSGPGKLVMALGIDQQHNDICLREGAVKIYDHQSFAKSFARPRAEHIITTPRIGLSSGAELPLRFYIRDSKFISRK